MNAVQTNSKVCEDIYSQGIGMLLYPNESLVRLTYRLLKPELHKQVLEYGFDPAANLTHLVPLSFAITGDKVSLSEVEIAKKCFAQENIHTDIRLFAGKSSTLEITISMRSLPCR